MLMAVTLVAMVELAQPDDRVRLRVDTSQAEAVLAIVETHASGGAATDADWARLFASAPYVRLKQRETSMRREFTDEAFRAFVLSPELAARAPALRGTLDDWRARDLTASARRVLGYLPVGARIQASVFPVIKPQSNSFIFDARGDAAIFLYLDPAQTAAKFENTVAHELHHIGFASVPPREAAPLPPPAQAAADWTGAFAEGFAMLAAAGDAGTHPHAVSDAEERAVWDAEMAEFNRHLRAVETFFLDVIDGRLVGEEAIRERALSFFGVQGPWYTVGYRMAVLVEQRFGRAVLIACMEDPRLILARYNEAARAQNARPGAAPLALWSPRLLEALAVVVPEPVDR